MALPDYSKYTSYKPYKADVGKAAISRKKFKKGKKGYVPAAPEEEPFEYNPAVYSPTPISPAPADYANHPFYNPATNYSTNPNQQQTMQPGSLAYFNYATNESPEGYYYGLLNEQGLGGTDARSQAGQAMFKDYARGYQAAKLKNQELWFPQYMEGQNTNAFLDQQSNEAIGIDDTRYQGRDRWGMRGY